MKIISRKDFFQLPENTLFCKFEPNVFGEVQIKVSESDNEEICDFITNGFTECVESRGEEQEYEARSNLKLGSEFRWAENQTSRDGMFEGDNVMFCIFDNQDIQQYINKLKTCINQNHKRIDPIIRRDGTSTRLLDDFVQKFFENGKVRIYDHYESDIGYREMFQTFMDRMEREHNINQYIEKGLVKIDKRRHILEIVNFKK